MTARISPSSAVSDRHRTSQAMKSLVVNAVTVLLAVIMILRTQPVEATPAGAFIHLLSGGVLQFAFPGNFPTGDRTFAAWIWVRSTSSCSAAIPLVSIGPGSCAAQTEFSVGFSWYVNLTHAATLFVAFS